MDKWVVRFIWGVRIFASLAVVLFGYFYLTHKIQVGVLSFSSYDYVMCTALILGFGMAWVCNDILRKNY